MAATEVKALREIIRRLKALDPNANVRPKRFEDAYREFLIRHAATLRAPSVYHHHFAVFRPYFNGKNVHQIEPADVQWFIAARLELGKKPATVNRYRSALRKFFVWAIENGYAGINPVANVKRLREAGGRTRDLSPDEYDRLLMGCTGYRGHLRQLIIAAVHLGARRHELLSLRWPDLDLERGFARFRAETTKTARERCVPLVPELIDMFRDMRSAQLAEPGDHEHVFTYYGRKIRDVKTAFEGACKTAKIENLHFHDLRHAFAGNFVSSGGSLYALQQLLGHSEPRMTQRYSRISRDFLMSTAQFIGIPGRPKAIAPKVEPPRDPDAPPPIPAETIEVLRDIRDLFLEKRVTWIGTAEILERLSAMPRWYKLVGPKMATCRVLAGMLRPVGVKPGQVGQQEDVNRKGYRIGNLAPVWARYLTDEGRA